MAILYCHGYIIILVTETANNFPSNRLRRYPAQHLILRTSKSSSTLVDPMSDHVLSTEYRSRNLPFNPHASLCIEDIPVNCGVSLVKPLKHHVS